MSSKKVIVIGLIVCSVILFSSINVMAAANWFSATVDSSTAGTTFQCELTGTEEGGGTRTFTKKTFLLYSPLKNSMLAVLLSAQSIGSSVRVYVDPEVGTFPTIYGIGLQSQ
ncbi:hypothetical protein DSCA_10100 [Desulfosarcina alkanivorans]|uniref:Uncharacterized protein n=1 Tax=Desulfosarcina alkanivorans TaxID=571177 RepID=A0A5K7YG83_9BACT|nr:hypothetical protein [Desulfosarcina alkanivorans]BBO67080.1 hypothetical protein DSCA_10100 [Desulfosarcina alkanivorans]